MMLQALVAGAAGATGLLLVASQWLDAPARYERRLAELYRPPSPDGLAAARRRWQSWAMATLARTSDLPSVARDLAVCGMTPEYHAVAKLTFAVVGAGLPLGVVAVWAVADIVVPVGVVALAAMAGGVVGFFVPDRVLARRAARRRRDFRYALSVFADLVVIVLTGGGGPLTALRRAAAAGSGWAFSELRQALEIARLQRASPWPALRALGERLGSPDLVELAASVELAGKTGASVRESLRAQAASVRDQELAEAEAEAIADAERMGGPVVAMFVGMLLFVGWPAMATLLAL